MARLLLPVSFIVVGAVIGAVLGSRTGNVTLVATTFAAVAGGIGESYARRREEQRSDCTT
jgi:uncharacterized protein YcfJ